jgi:hypothetical protein
MNHLSGFIAIETIVTDELGVLSTHVRSAKGKSKAKGKAKTRKEIQKAKYYFVASSKKTAAYKDYFNPDVDVERRMMGLSEAVRDDQHPLSLPRVSDTLYMQDVRPRMHRMQDMPVVLAE